MGLAGGRPSVEWAPVQCSTGLQLPGDEVQSAGRVMAEFTLHGQGCAHRKQQTQNPGAALG